MPEGARFRDQAQEESLLMMDMFGFSVIPNEIASSEVNSCVCVALRVCCPPRVVPPVCAWPACVLSCMW